MESTNGCLPSGRKDHNFLVAFESEATILKGSGCFRDFLLRHGGACLSFTHTMGATSPKRRVVQDGGTSWAGSLLEEFAALLDSVGPGLTCMAHLVLQPTKKKKAKLTEDSDDEKLEKIVEKRQAAKKRKRNEKDKLPRTIFVGNLPPAVKSKELKKEFAQFGDIESVRLRSLSLEDVSQEDSLLETLVVLLQMDSAHDRGLFSCLAMGTDPRARTRVLPSS
jgi:hypothetical protein